MGLDRMVERPIFKPYFEKSADVLWDRYEMSKLQKSSTNTGSNRELFCDEFLYKVLPPRIKVVRGEIWDGKGNWTEQLEIIVIRDDCPKLSFGGADVFPAEGVFGVVEVKSKLTRSVLLSALKQLKRVRLLKPFSGAGGSYGPIPLRLFCCIFAYEGDISEALEELKKPENSSIVDMLCILRDGILISDTSLLRRPFTEDREPLLEQNVDEPYLVRGKAASLGFLWYYFVSYSASFIGQSMEFQQYFKPLNSWFDSDESH